MRLSMLAIALLLLGPATAHAERAYPVQVAWKFARGIANLALAPVEVPVNAYKEGNRAYLDGGNLAEQSMGLFTGTISGLGYTGARIGVGLFDLVTFPVPSRPVMRPGAPHTFLEVVLTESPPPSVPGPAPAHDESQWP
jgi:putative exosortase-associated protein (TIGR04073 family)